MTLVKSDSIDIVFLAPDKKKVSLVAYDGGEVPDATDREEALQKKLRSYLEFVASGQFLQTYPQYSDIGVDIMVVCLNPPTESMKKIQGIRDHDRPETFLTVTVITDAEFRSTLPKNETSITPKPWWRFWS
jgi:hypothetical protein